MDCSGAGVNVHQIGCTTCGKPYGFYPQDNCGTTYFSIQFRGVNEQGFGDYADGFSAARTAATGDPRANLPGCAARDDLARQLGDPSEELLRVALTYRQNGTCTPILPLSADTDGRKQAAASGLGRGRGRTGTAGRTLEQQPHPALRYRRALSGARRIAYLPLTLSSAWRSSSAQMPMMRRASVEFETEVVQERLAVS